MNKFDKLINAASSHYKEKILIRIPSKKIILVVDARIEFSFNL